MVRPGHGRVAGLVPEAAVTGDPEDEDDVGYESGPFCHHWSDPGDCDAVCACGHKCREHGRYGNEECEVDGCACKGPCEGGPGE